MTRLQKKCLIAAAGAHLLVVVAILCSGFIRPTPKVDDTPVLDVIPSTLVDALLNSGVKSAQPPPPTPVPPTPTPTPVVATPPQPVTPPTPPTTSLMDRVKSMLTPDKPTVDDTKPDDQPEPKPKPHKIDVSLTPVVHKVSKTTDTSATDDAKEQKKLRDERRKAFAAAAQSIKDNASSATTVEMHGTSSVSYANYAAVVKSIYERSWTAPDNTASDEANVRVKVLIASDGHVISSSILTPSGDSSVDDSVQRTLDRVTVIAPFPDGATETERPFIINFNLKAKRMLE